MYFVCTCMPGESYCSQLGSLLLCLCDVFQVLINSLCADSAQLNIIFSAFWWYKHVQVVQCDSFCDGRSHLSSVYVCEGHDCWTVPNVCLVPVLAVQTMLVLFFVPTATAGRVVCSLVHRDLYQVLKPSLQFIFRALCGVCFFLFVIFSLRVCVWETEAVSLCCLSIKCSKSNAWQLALFALYLTLCVCERERADKFITVCCGFLKQICMFYPQHSSNLMWFTPEATVLICSSDQCVSLPQHSCSFMWFTYYISSSCTGLFPCVCVPQRSCGLTCFYILQLKQLYMCVPVCVFSTVQLQFNMFYVLHITAQAAVRVRSGVSQATVQVCSGVCMSHSAVPV